LPQPSSCVALQHLYAREWQRVYVPESKKEEQTANYLATPEGQAMAKKKAKELKRPMGLKVLKEEGASTKKMKKE